MDSAVLPLSASVVGVAVPAAAWLVGAPAWGVALLGATGVIGAAAAWARERNLAYKALAGVRVRLGLGEADTGARADEVAGDLIEQLRSARAAAEAGRDELGRLKRLLGVIDEPSLGIDAVGLVMVCNPAAEALLGVRADRALGRPLEEVFTQTEVVNAIAEARAGRSVRQQVRVTRADGARVWEISAQPAGDPGASRAVAVCIQDVTAAAMALQVKADFVANASHELRTPIAAMRIAVDTLGAVGPEDGAMRERLMGVIATNVGRLEEMVRDLLDLSRLESPDAPAERSPVDMGEVTRELAAMFEPACLQRRLTLEFDVPPGLNEIQTDRRLLTIILGNLIDNATKYAFEGTAVRVIARAIDGPDESRGMRFEVSDRGMGIPLDQQARIFERYYQVNAARTPGSPRRGTGLGLSIVKHALRRLGGTIRVQSVWQQGTTMIVDLPGCLAGDQRTGR